MNDLHRSPLVSAALHIFGTTYLLGGVCQLKKKTCLILALVLICSFIVSGCKPKVEPDAGGNDSEPKVGGTLVVGDSWSVVNLDPALYNDEGSWHVINLVFDALVDHDPDRKIIPRLATSWENPDNLTWVFNLHEGAKWQDDNEVYAKGEGPEVTAEDVKYSIERILDSETKSSRYNLVESIDKVEAIDKYKVKITTKRPDAFLLDNLASVYVVNKKVVETLGPEKFSRNPIGSGPFKLEEVKPDDYVSLVRNDDHWLKPNLDKIILKPIPDPNALLMALEAGDVDLVAQIPQKDVERIGATPGLVVMKQGTAAYRFIAFNCEKDPTSSLEFRDAICAAIDMDGAVNAIFPPGMAERAVGPVAPPNLGYDPSLSKYWEYNPEKALETLGKLGWKDTDSDGVLDKEGKPLKLRIIAPQDANRSKLSVIVATSLNEIGIKAEVQNLEWGTLLSESDKGNFDMLILGGYSGPNGMIFMFHSRNKGPNGNSARYENPRVDELLELGVTLLDPEEREPVWKEAQELVVKDRAHMPAYHEYFFFAYNDEVKDYAGNFQFVSEINNVWLGR